MEQYRLELTEQGKQNLTETIDTLMQAAQEIANSSEQDFERMKSKKWYKRLWELVTCSKDNQKTTARGVSNLAKLTEIVMKAIVILANHSEETAQNVSDALRDIENLEGRLDELSIKFKKVALEVRRLKFNYKKSLSIDNLKAEERDIVGSLFSKYTKLCYSEGLMPNDASRNLYTFAMEGDIPEEDIDISTHLDKLNPEVQKLLYRLNQSYYYLIAGDFDDSDYFDDFSVSVKDIKMIKKQIEDTVLFSGPENYAKTLVPDKTLDFIDGDGLIFEEEIKNTVTETTEIPKHDDAKFIGLFTVNNTYGDIITGSLMICCKHIICVDEVINVFDDDAKYIGKAQITGITNDFDNVTVNETNLDYDFYNISIDSSDLPCDLHNGKNYMLQKAEPKAKKTADYAPAKAVSAPEFVLDNRIGFFNVCDKTGSIVTCPLHCDHVIEEGEIVDVFNTSTKEYHGEAKITGIEKFGGLKAGKVKVGELYFVSIDTSNLIVEMNEDDMYGIFKKEIGASAPANNDDFDSFETKKRIFKNYIYDIVTIQSSVEIGGHNKKVRNAISSFAPVIDEDDVIGFYDSTVFGSGKSGYIFTTTGVIFKDMGPTVMFDYENIFDMTTTVAKKDCNKTLLITLDNMRTVEITTVSFNKTPLLDFLEEMRGLC